MSIIEKDQEQYHAARELAHKDLLAYAAKASGRGVFAIQKEFGQLAKSPTKLNMVEYVRNGLFREDRFCPDERANFLSNDLHWEIAHQCNNEAWQGSAEDKVLAATLLKAGGVPVPEALCVIDTSARHYPNIRKIGTAAELKDILAAYKRERIFGKIADGMVSFGAFLIEEFDDDTVTCAGHGRMSFAAFMSDIIDGNAYLLQRELRNHSDIAPFASALGTVRVVNMVRDDGVLTPFALIKLPQGENIADAFWREGNLACGIDVATGRIETVVLGGAENTFLDDHPVAPGLKGMVLPHWQELLRVNEIAAHLFAPIRYQSTDIAITENGPVIVELNYGGSFDLIQYANGRGMLTAETRDFFASCGVDLTGNAPKARRGFFGR